MFKDGSTFVCLDLPCFLKALQSPNRMTCRTTSKPYPEQRPDCEIFRLSVCRSASAARPEHDEVAVALVELSLSFPENSRLQWCGLVFVWQKISDGFSFTSATDFTLKLGMKVLTREKPNLSLRLKGLAFSSWIQNNMGLCAMGRKFGREDMDCM